MTDESQAKRGEAAWKEQREAISRRNAEAHKRAEGRRKSRASQLEAQARAESQRESQQLRDLNTRISKQQARGVR
jgi:hypothetical protein